MSTPSPDGWSSPQSGDSAPTDQGQPYGQPFDSTVSSPTQQPPPPGWEQGTWTHHADATSPDGNGRWLLLIGIAVLVVVILVAAVAFLVL